MPNIFLPSLQKVIIQDFSLYPKERKLVYKFVSGVNLVIGGNGMGKTTFLNIIKFAIIGLYKKGTVVKRRKEKRYQSREHISYNYFRNRMDNSVDYNDNAFVELHFKIDDELHKIKRRLIDGAVLNYSVVTFTNGLEEELEYEGTIMNQEDYDLMHKDLNKFSIPIQNSLQHIYEKNITRCCGLANFDILIFLLNDVLFFNEERKTIMWGVDFQNTFTSLFLIEPKNMNLLAKEQLDRKYYDSLARHKGEDIRALKKVYDRLKIAPDFDKSLVDLMDRKNQLQKRSNQSFEKLQAIQKDRKFANRDLDRMYVKRNEAFKTIADLDSQYGNMESSFYSDLFSAVTPKYRQYLKFLKSNGDCPLCNTELDKDVFNRIVKEESSCMMCGSELNRESTMSKELVEAKAKVSKLRTKLMNFETRIVELEDQLQDYDRKYREEQGNYNKFKSDLRTTDFSIDKILNEGDTSSDKEFSALKKRMDELEAEKELNFEKSKKAKETIDKLLATIDQEKMNGRLRLSEIFNKYASKFLGVSCELVYEESVSSGEKQYLPRIDGVDRITPEELSESQRFFIDQAFRMSLLSFFNNSSSFLLSETPDASLDISYEINAAAVYLEFIKDPNELVITSNLNNSDFLLHLINGTPKNQMNHINLLNIGKNSDVQKNSSRLTEASNTIEKLFNE